MPYGRLSGCLLLVLSALGAAREDLLGNFVGAVFDYGDGGRFMPVGNVRFKRQAAP